MKLIENFSSVLKKGFLRVKLIGHNSLGQDVFAVFNDDGTLVKQYGEGDVLSGAFKEMIIAGYVNGGTAKAPWILQHANGYFLGTAKPKSFENSVSAFAGTTLNYGTKISSTPYDTYDGGLRQMWATVQYVVGSGTPNITIRLQVAVSNSTVDTNWTTVVEQLNAVAGQVYNLHLNEDDLFKFFRIQVEDTSSDGSSTVYADMYPVK